MAIRPVHPEVQKHADQLFMQALPRDMSSKSTVWTVEKLLDTNARILQEKVEIVLSDCLERLREDSSVEEEEFFRNSLQRLAYYPSIHANLLALIQAKRPNFALVAE